MMPTKSKYTIALDQNVGDSYSLHCRRLLQEIFFEHKNKATFTGVLPLSYSATDEAGCLVAGLAAVAVCDYLYIEALWVSANFRNQKIGSTLLNSVEQKASQLGCLRILVTSNGLSDSSEFWLRNAYAQFYELKDCSKKFSIKYFQKIL